MIRHLAKRLALWMLKHWGIVTPREISLAAKLSKEQAARADAESAVEVLRASLVSLSEERDGLRGELADAKAALAAAGQDKSTLVENNKKLWDELGAVAEQNIKHVARISYLEEENRDLGHHNGLLKGSVADLSERLKHVVPIPENVVPVLDAAKDLVERFQKESRPGTSGEWKRHAIYDQLQQQFPSVAKRDLSMAIEVAVRDL